MHTHIHTRVYTLTYSTIHPLVLHCFPLPLTQAENTIFDYSQVSNFSTPRSCVESTAGVCACLPLWTEYHPVKLCISVRNHCNETNQSSCFIFFLYLLTCCLFSFAWKNMLCMFQSHLYSQLSDIISKRNLRTLKFHAKFLLAEELQGEKQNIRTLTDYYKIFNMVELRLFEHCNAFTT